MFEIPRTVADAWAAKGFSKAAPEGLSRLRAIFGADLPKTYEAFLTEYGFVEFGHDPEGWSHFVYRRATAAGVVSTATAVASLHDPETIEQILHYITMDDPGNGSPRIPSGVIPVASDAEGEAQVLLEVATGRVLYLPKTFEAWGTGGNTWLGLIADDFASFVNGLRPGES